MEVDPPVKLPDASPVLYINNLNEKVKLDVLKQSLLNLFKNYGPVLQITAHKSIRMRGQAFITLQDAETAAKAIKEVNRFPLYGRAIQITYAKTLSDAAFKATHQDKAEFDKHLEQRRLHKKIARKDNPLRRKFLAQKEAAKNVVQSTTGESATSKRIIQMPNEYLPPNKILFVQNLPDDTSKETLEGLFKVYPNLVEVRTIPGRKNIAFVEFADENASGVARDGLHNTRLGDDEDGKGGLRIKVTFAKQ